MFVRLDDDSDLSAHRSERGTARPEIILEHNIAKHRIGAPSGFGDTSQKTFKLVDYSHTIDFTSCYPA